MRLPNCQQRINAENHKRNKIQVSHAIMQTTPNCKYERFQTLLSCRKCVEASENLVTELQQLGVCSI